MKKVLLILAVLFALSFAGRIEYSRVTVEIQLTDEQVEMINSSRAGAEVDFTRDQLATIRDLVPEFDFTSVDLLPEHIGRAEIVILELEVPKDFSDPDAIIRMDPQPSP
ncbi:MAG: hypothetical protein GF388_11425 [Candidatus Aegiribacteria sp.]|nr:hypothetical protein [Candidatus Aegiribacteria sp.]MBD3295603.1 hypothetical protein [Candidatus Fermentibacteria bacterium]